MKNLDHPDRELLIRLALGEMTELDAKPILTHLASCDSCRGEFLGCCDDLEKLRGDDPVLAEDLNLGAERRLALMAKFRGMKKAPPPFEPISFPTIPGSLIQWFVAVAAAGILAAMLLPSLGSVREKSNVTKAKNEVKQQNLEIASLYDEMKEAGIPVPAPVGDGSVPPPPPALNGNQQAQTQYYREMAAAKEQEVLRMRQTLESRKPAAPAVSSVALNDPHLSNGLESIEDKRPETSDPSSVVLNDPHNASGLESIDDNPPSTNDAGMVNLVSDVKSVVSPTTSSKMYGGRRAAGRAGATAEGTGRAEVEKKASAVGGEFPEDEGGLINQKDASAKEKRAWEAYHREPEESRKKVMRGDGRVKEEKAAKDALLSENPQDSNRQLGKNEKLQAREGNVKDLDGATAKADKQLDQVKTGKDSVAAKIEAEMNWKWHSPVAGATMDRNFNGKGNGKSALSKVLGSGLHFDRTGELTSATPNEGLDSSVRSLKGLPDFNALGGTPAVLGGKREKLRNEAAAKAASEQVIIEAKVVNVSEKDMREMGFSWRPAPPDPLLLKQNAAADQLLAESAKRGEGRDEAQAAAQEEAQSKAQAEAEAAKPSENAEAAKAAVNAKPAAEHSEEVRQEPTPAEELARRDKEREAAKQRALCFKDANKEPLSTFAMDVDTASYQRVKEMIQKGQSVSPEAVRTEEFVNAFNYNYATPEASSFAIHAEHAPSNLGQGRKLLRVAVQAARPGADSRRPSRLTILVDTSGSMARENRLPLLRKVLPEMLKQMRPSDSLTLIACDSSPRLLADRIPAGDTERLERAFAELKPSGATNLEAGLGAAYKNATEHFDPAGMNRLVLISDGVANLGNTEAESILGRAVEARRLGVSATVIGMGRGEYNDRFLETLADKGNGFYAYVDNAESAQRVFVDNFAANFSAIAKDAKIQMEFDPEAVRSWRLLGYENRLLAAAEFRDDKVGGGSVGPGQSVTAVYELDCVPGLAPEARLGVMHIRYQDPSGRLARESERAIYGRDGAASFDSASFSLRLAAVAAQFAEQLKGYNRDHELTLKALHQLALEQAGNPALGELIQLMEKVGGEDVKL